MKERDEGLRGNFDVLRGIMILLYILKLRLHGKKEGSDDSPGPINSLHSHSIVGASAERTLHNHVDLSEDPEQCSRAITPGRRHSYTQRWKRTVTRIWISINYGYSAKGLHWQLINDHRRTLLGLELSDEIIFSEFL